MSPSNCAAPQVSRRLLLRGDTDFSQRQHLDRWHAAGDVRFVFGLDVTPRRHIAVDDLPFSAWKPLKRLPRYTIQTQPRAKPRRVKPRIVSNRSTNDTGLPSSEWSYNRKSFLRELKRKLPEQYAAVDAEILRKYVERQGDGCFADTRPSESKRRLPEAAQDMYLLVKQFQQTAAPLESFQLLARIFDEQPCRS
jgi:hypothetical protein